MGTINDQTIRARQQGFTLLELLVVLVIAGMTLGMVSFNAMPSDRQVLQGEAQRIALLLQLARDEAIVRNRLISFEASPERYQFMMREEGQWEPIPQDQLLHERSFKHAPVSLSLKSQEVEGTGALRIVFGREPVDKPFILTLAQGETFVEIHADGIGHFVVE